VRYAQPNLSRLKNDKVTPKFETLTTIAAALNTHPALVSAESAGTWTLHEFTKWKIGLLWKGVPRDLATNVGAVRMVDLLLASPPEHAYARRKFLNHANFTPNDSDLWEYNLNAEKWGREQVAAHAAQKNAKRRS
jgi:hypothetical protein